MCLRKVCVCVGGGEPLAFQPFFVLNSGREACVGRARKYRAYAQKGIEYQRGRRAGTHHRPDHLFTAKVLSGATRAGLIKTLGTLPRIRRVPPK